MTGWLVTFLGVVAVGWVAAQFHYASKLANRKVNSRHTPHDNIDEGVKTPSHIAKGG